METPHHRCRQVRNDCPAPLKCVARARCAARGGGVLAFCLTLAGTDWDDESECVRAEAPHGWAALDVRVWMLECACRLEMVLPCRSIRHSIVLSVPIGMFVLCGWVCTAVRARGAQALGRPLSAGSVCWCAQSAIP